MTDTSLFHWKDVQYGNAPCAKPKVDYEIVRRAKLRCGKCQFMCELTGECTLRREAVRCSQDVPEAAWRSDDIREFAFARSGGLI